MSVTTLHHISSPSISGLRILFQRVLSRTAPQDRSLNALRSLPDHLLLDIGVDPREIRTRGVDMIEQAETFDSDLTALHFRSIAKS